MRIAVFLFVLVASASLLPAVAHAQPPAQLSPPGQLSPPAEPAPTGSISGHIVFVGPQGEFLEHGPDVGFFLYLFPTDLTQPIDFFGNYALYLEHVIQPDPEGNFSFTGLADGEYFIISLGGSIEDSMPLPENVTFVSVNPRVAFAVRVNVANGDAVTGIEIVIRVPEFFAFLDCAGEVPQPLPPLAELSPPNGLAPLNDIGIICPPTTGAGPGGANGSADRIAAGLAALAALLLAGGLALRARGTRVL